MARVSAVTMHTVSSAVHHDAGAGMVKEAAAHRTLAHETEISAGAAGVLVIAGAAEIIGALQAGVQAGLLGAARFVVALRRVHEQASVQPAPAAASPHLRKRMPECVRLVTCNFGGGAGLDP